MRYRYYESEWDCMLADELTDEIINLDKAHKRAKRALRQQQKYILKLQKELKYYKHVNTVLQYEKEMLEEFVDDWL